MSFWEINELVGFIKGDLLGSELLFGAVVLLVAFMGLSTTGVPTRLALAFLVPLAVSLTLVAYIGSWVGWVVVLVVGAMFGFMLNRLYGSG